MKKMLISLALAATVPLGMALSNDGTPSAAEVEVYIISPMDGESVKNPVTVRFGLKGMGIAPAGTEKENTGHHHLIIDTDLPPLDENIPMDEQHVHFGGGQTETSIELTPGKHTFQLLLGDMNHIPHDPAVVSQKITITVVE
ncbi:DUF4399 domain-containing protein [Kordiimonas aestuarii]|uniref:DUF4399 domain-containing protein n=1 Tax=Kordiimonas aestuarii TaxID=1005925 RepID=UPI0021CDFB2E|nr:DUF4399 domain-containing protein [Kordiimonas aestuarii]